MPVPDFRRLSHGSVTVLPTSRISSHGGITIPFSVEEMPLPNCSRPGYGSLTFTSGEEEILLPN